MPFDRPPSGPVEPVSVSSPSSGVGEPALDGRRSPRSAHECEFREACPFAIGLFLVLVVTLSLVIASLAWASPARAQSSLDAVPIGGFQPWVAFTLTNEFSNENQDDLFFVADVDSTFNPSRAMPTANAPIYQVGLLDSGSQVNLLTADATAAFDVVGQGFGGTELIEAVGVSGSEFLTVQDPLGIFTAGLQHATGGAAVNVTDTATLRGLKSNAPASAPAGSVLPNVIGLPMMATHTTIIRNSQPQFIEDGDDTFRAPAVEFLPLGSDIPADFSRRAALGLEVNATFGTTEPLYVFNVGNALSGAPLHDNPSTPTAVGGAFFTDIDIANAGTTRTAEVFFDTGAQVSVVNELLAAQLGFDVVNDEPDFTVPIIGVGGAQSEIPGFIADSLTVPAVGGNFTATNVPIVVLENVPNPLGAGILDGILGTNVFWDRDLAIDPSGDRLWISDPVTAEVEWTQTFTPTQLDAARVEDSLVFMQDDERMFRLRVAAEPPGELFVPARLDVRDHRLEVYTDLQIGDGGSVLAVLDGVVSTQNISIESGGTLSGSGTFIGDTITNAGTLHPIQSIGDPMRLVGTYTQTHAGRMVYSGVSVDVDGNASLAGELVMAIDAETTPYGPAVTIFEGDAISGTFDTVLQAGSDSGYVWAITYLANEVQATVALFGDANLNQSVEQADLDVVLGNWGQTGMTWAQGDFNGNGTIEQADLDAVLTNWGSSATPDFRGVVVPEPTAGLVMLVLGACASRRRRVI